MHVHRWSRYKVHLLNLHWAVFFFYEQNYGTVSLIKGIKKVTVIFPLFSNLESIELFIIDSENVDLKTLSQKSTKRYSIMHKTWRELKCLDILDLHVLRNKLFLKDCMIRFFSRVIKYRYLLCDGYQSFVSDIALELRSDILIFS